MKSLNVKLEALRNDPQANEFILADTKDADMAWGIASPGHRSSASGKNRYKSMNEFMDQMREITASGYVDILVASNSVMSILAHQDRIFEESPVTPAIRTNDSTDVWISRVANYRAQPSRPFRSANLREAQYGSLTAEDGGEPVVNLGLYSITFNNDLDADLRTLEAFREFRQDAASCGFEYFLEVFPPNVPYCGIPNELIPTFVNDSLVRALAGVARPHWPIFLKVPYFGPAALEELAAYDRDLIVGILGGAAGTTYDAFKQLSEAQKYGARVALYGRKIKFSEHPLTMVRLMRTIVDGDISPEEAVDAYHGELQKLGIEPHRELAKDRQMTFPELNYLV